ncbi:MAG: acyltransferase family protein [Bacteroidaceae bacterium]|nr:acyltransferase family protein [Bacteroidaceae bacterium]
MNTSSRISELDFLKGFFIIMMITFHLVYIGDLYPYTKRIVYTFHMPGFLIISGYLMNINKHWKDFLKTMLSYAVPYVIMESCYIVMASLLPIREHLDVLTSTLFFDKLFLHPLGPYWYLHTMMICGFTYMFVFNLIPLKPISRILLLGIIYNVISGNIGIMSFSCSMYFLIGVILRQSGLPFTCVFKPSALAVLAFILLSIHSQNLQMNRLDGVLIVCLVISGLLFVYSRLGDWMRILWTYLGRKTMSLFLFSPIFTFLCKSLIPALQFEPTGLLYLSVSLLICICGCLSIEWILCRLGIAL